MTLAEAIARLERMRERRVEKAQAYCDVAAEYEARAISADEVLHSHQRDFLIELGMAAQRSAKTMREDAEALGLVLIEFSPEAKACAATLQKARAFINADSPDWRVEKQNMLNEIDKALYDIGWMPEALASAGAP